MKKIFILVLFIICSFIINKSVYAEELIPNGKSGVLIDAGSGKIIYEKDKDKRLSIASLTKMVGQIIILEEVEAGKIKWSDMVTVSRNASDMGGSQIYLEEGEKISVEDLMKGISVASGNDAIVAMAEYISGSEEKFVKRMNKVVKRLRLKNTHFTNCTGLDEKNHYSSSYDIALVARELVLNHPEIIKFSSIYEDYLREDSDNKFWLVNTNKLINFYEGADGLKTGHTDDAGYCLAATAKRNNLRLIGIVLGEENSKVRNKEVMEMLDYGFNSIKQKCLKKKNNVVDKLYFEKANNTYANVVLKDDLCVIEDKDENKHNYTFDIKYNNYKLPISKDNNIGKIIVRDRGKVISENSLYIDRNIDKISFLDFIKKELLSLVFSK